MTTLINHAHKLSLDSIEILSMAENTLEMFANIDGIFPQCSVNVSDSCLPQENSVVYVLEDTGRRMDILRSVMIELQARVFRASDSEKRVSLNIHSG
jgi:hypothetical protein